MQYRRIESGGGNSPFHKATLIRVDTALPMTLGGGSTYDFAPGIGRPIVRNSIFMSSQVSFFAASVRSKYDG